MFRKILRLIFFALVALLIFLVSCNAKDTNLDHYLKGDIDFSEDATEVMPKLSELPPHEDIRYQYQKKYEFIFRSESAVLLVKYDKETYQSEKERIEKSYVFLDHAVEEVMPQYEFAMGSYSFRVIEETPNKVTANYPHYFGMIAMSEEKSSIAYLYFHDQDLDVVSEKKEQPMQDFMKNYFPFDWE